MSKSKKFLKPLALISFLAVTSFAHAEEDWGVFIGQDGEYQSTGNLKFQPKIFIPLTMDPNSVVFVDLRSYINVQEQSGANVAFGYRGQIDSGSAFGINGGLDFHYSKNGNLLPQGSLGLEFLTEFVDMNVNFYAPLAGQVDVAGTGIAPYARLNNNSLEILWKDPAKETTLFGSDANVKLKLPVTKGLSLLLEGGVFYYFGNDYTPSVYGYQAQAKANAPLNLFGLDSSAFIGGGIRQDNTQNKPNWFVNVGVSVALGGKNGNNAQGLKQSMYTSPTRRGTPQVGYKKEGASLEVAQGTTVINGHDYSKVYKLSASDDIVAAINSAGNDSLVILTGDNGTINVTQSVQVHQGQSILGKGTALVVKGPGGRTAVLLVNGSQSTVKNNNSSANTFVLDSNTLLQDVNVQGGKNGVYVVNADNAKIVNVSVSGANANGVNISNSTNVTISNALIQTSAVNGVQILGSNAVTIKNSTIQGSTANGVLTSTSGNVTITDSTIQNSGQSGILADTVTSLNVNNTNIINSGAYGINANEVGTLNVNNSVINGATNNGINYTKTGNGQVYITGSDVKNVGGHGINIYETSIFGDINAYIDNVVIDGVGSTKANINYDGLGDLTISNVATFGGTGIIASTDSSGQIKIKKVNLSNVGNKFGIYINASNGTVEIDQAVINASGSVGIYVSNAASVTASSVEVNGSDVGISVYNSDNVVVADSVLAIKDKGIYVEQANSVILTDNFISAYGFDITNAIELYNTSNVDVSNNGVNDADYGIKIGNSSNVTGSNNTALNNLFDCYIYLSSNVIVGVNSAVCSTP